VQIEMCMRGSHYSGCVEVFFVLVEYFEQIGLRKSVVIRGRDVSSAAREETPHKQTLPCRCGAGRCWRCEKAAPEART
jgi:hypothetical protein